MDLFQKAYRTAMTRLPASLAISLQFARAHGRWPNLSAPRSFSEKIQWRKLRERNPTFVRMVDKVAVKELLQSKIGKSAIIPSLWTGTEVHQETLGSLPLPFVLKASHSSGQNAFVRLPAELTNDLAAKANEWVRAPFRPHVREWAYENVRPQLLIEPFIGEGHDLPLDYKFFVFDGAAEFIQVDVGRESDHRRCFYDKSWQRVDVALEYPLERSSIDRPRYLAEMRELAEAVASVAGTNFIRVDLYEVSGRPYFGEVTFYPGSGYERFRPAKFDRLFGEMWTLPQ